MEILRSAIEYIEYLEEILQGAKSPVETESIISITSSYMVSFIKFKLKKKTKNRLKIKNFGNKMP